MATCIPSLNCEKYLSIENCRIVKWGGIAIVSALAAIVTIGALLVIVAQQGYSLGSINALASLIESKWVYLIFSISLISFACTTAIIVKMGQVQTPKEKIEDNQIPVVPTLMENLVVLTLDEKLEQACQTSGAKERCQNAGDIFLLDPITYKDQPVFALYIKTLRGSQIFHWASAEERVAALSLGGKYYGYCIRNASLNSLYAFNDPAMPNILPDSLFSLLVGFGDYWLFEDGRISYREKDKMIYTNKLDHSQEVPQEVPQEEKYSRNIGEEYKSLKLVGRYPTAFGKYLYYSPQIDLKRYEDAILSEEYWRLKTQKGKGIYQNYEVFPLLVCHANQEKEWHFFRDAEARKNFLQSTNYLDGVLRHRLYLDQIVLNPGDFYQLSIKQPGKMGQLVVYCDTAGKLQRKFKTFHEKLPDDGTFVKDMNQELEHFKKIGQYPPTLGRYLSSKIDPSLAETALLTGEYWDFEKQVDQQSAYPEVFPFLIHQADGTQKWLYFTNENARTAARTGLQSGRERHLKAVAGFKTTLSVMSRKTPLIIGNGYYRTIELKDSRILILWLDGGGMEKAEYYSKAESESKIKKLNLKTRI